LERSGVCVRRGTLLKLGTDREKYYPPDELEKARGNPILYLEDAASLKIH
jgi:hypothetical protein